MSWVNEIKNAPFVKKYSQCGEEGYLEYILSNIPSYQRNHFLIDLGAGDGFSLSNSRYFIEKGFQSILIDGNNHDNEQVQERFITDENIIELLQYFLCPMNPDLLTIDLDGNDLYIMEKVASVYKPKVIIAEFNPIWGFGVSKAIKYDPDHQWNDDDYYGFSFAAGLKFAHKNGYTCIFQNDSLNMYFVDNDVLMKSLGIFNVLDIHSLFEPVTYTVTHNHKHSNRTEWVDY